jgi:ABC-type polysaccharide/polyol phosphate export permease
LIEQLQQLARFHELLSMLAWRDIRVRYKQTIMGFLWAVLMPSLVVGAGAIVRIAVARYSNSTVTADDIASVMVRAVAWSFFISGIRFGTSSLMGDIDLVKNLAFPKEVFPLAATLSSLFDFAIATAAVAGILLIIGWQPGITALWAIPLVLVLVALTAGLALFLSAANLFFRDVKYLVEVFLTFAIFFTPVLYDVTMLGKWSDLALLNPVAPVLEELSASVVFHRTPDAAWLSYAAIVSFVILLVGYWFFKQLEARFAESI